MIAHAKLVTVDNDVIAVSAREVALLMCYRQLPRAMRHAVHDLITYAVHDTSALPLLVHLEKVAAIYGLSVATVRRKCSEGSFSPLPARKYPYRWRRDDILRDINGPTKRLPRRAHGFAAAKARRLTDHDDKESA